eukprot:TRINITY_DN4087_c0_g4_i1.p1 TRINITY_DN4087_c0_g4~~TRINITY_DN4087_c0_g4_i1.p1  ORF type:complete len:2815 (-),score=725.60 TRINITY_DN4087_c0_g4_i1:124-7932(-)
MGGAALIQPAKLTVDANTGDLTFNTTGVAQGLWQTQVIIYDSVGTTPVDFLILVVARSSYCGSTCSNAGAVCTSSSGCLNCVSSPTSPCAVDTPPVFVSPTPAAGTTYCLQSGVTFTMNIAAMEYYPTAVPTSISLLNSALPTGAVVTATTTSSANPANATFSWRPTASQSGKWLICFSAIGSHGLKSTANCITLNVDLRPVAPSVYSLKPSGGFYNTTTRVQVNGTAFTPGLIQCKLGTNLVDGTYNTFSQVTCVAPSVAAPSSVVVEVSSFCDAYSNNTRLFQYFGYPQVFNVTPGLTLANTPVNVTVTGSGFVNVGNTPQCLVGGVAVPGTYISDSTIICFVQNPGVGTSTVSVSNDQTFFPPVVTNPPTVFAFATGSLGTVLPLISMYGGTILVANRTILNNDTAQVRCVVGGDYSIPVQVSPHPTAGNATCTYPSGTAGNTLTLTLTNDGGWQYNWTLTYYGVANAVSVSPSTGAAMLATLVTVTTQNAVNVPSIACIWDGLTSTQATYVTATQVRCMTPSASVAGASTLGVANDGTHVGTTTLYTYFGAPNVTTVTPGSTITTTAVTLTVGSAAYFLNIPTLSCKLGTVVSVATYVNPSTVRCAAPAQGAALLDVAVSNNGNWFGTSLPFRFYAIGAPTENNFVSGLGNGGLATVALRTVLQTDLAQISCLWGPSSVSSAATASVVGPLGSVTCPVAVTGAAGTTTTLTIQGDLGWSASWTLTFFGVANVGTPSVTTIPAQTPSTITVTGSGFVNVSTLACEYNGQSVPAIYVSPTQVVCQVPPLVAGPTTLEVTNDGASTGVTTTIYSSLLGTQSVTQISSAGVGTVTISLRTVLPNNGANVLCKWGSASAVTAQSWIVELNEGQVVCAVPAGTAGTTNTLIIQGDNGLQTPFTFTYYAAGSVSTSGPAVGLSSQNTPVTVGGSGFVDVPTLSCNFGGQVVTATFVTSTQVLCAAPPVSGSATVAVTVLNDGVTPGASTNFRYYGPPVVTLLNPTLTLTNTGPTVGVSSSDAFFNSASLRCRVGGSNGAATYVNGSYLLCAVPAQSAAQLPLLVSNDATIYGSGPNFKYCNVGTVSSTLVSAFGVGTVTITGRTVLPAGGASISCRYGTTPAVGAQSSTTSATVGTIVCPVVAGIANTVVSLTTLNDGGLPSTWTLNYYGAATVNSNPNPTSWVSGSSTTITVTGTNIIDTPLLACKFGTYVSAATYVSATEVKCTAPSTAPGTILLSILNDGVNGDGTTPFRFYGPPAVTSTAPSLVLENSVVQIAVRSNDEFWPLGTIKCKVSSSIVTATFVNGSYVTCALPAQVAGSKSVQVSNDGTNFGTAGSMIYCAEGIAAPQLISAFGSLTVRVSARTVLNQLASIRCVYNGTVSLAATAASVHDSVGGVTCTYPPGPPGTNATLMLVNDGGWPLSYWPLTYYGAPTIPQQTLPLVESGQPGQTIAVTAPPGSFVNVPSLACNIGGVTVAATFVSDTQVICAVPDTLPPSIATVAVANDGLNFGPTSTNQTVATEGTASTEFIDATGRGNVTIGPRTVLNSTDVWCNYGGTKVRPVEIHEGVADGYIVCPVPAAQPDTSVILTIEGDGGLPTATEVFYYGDYAIPSITSLWRPNGVAYTAQVVTIYGAAFYNVITLRVKFGTMQVRAQYMTATSLRTTTPVVVPQTVQVTVQNNGLDSSNALPYRYYGPPDATAIYPLGYLENNGPTTVGVWSDDAFVDSGLMQCRILITATAATFVNSSYVICAVPSRAASRVSVAVANDGFRFGSTQWFTYFATGVPSVLVGTQFGGIPMSITGRSMLTPNTAACVFGTTKAEAAVSDTLDDFAYIYTLGCTIPASPPRTTTLTVIDDGGWPTTWVFNYLEECSYNGSNPVISSTLGGTELLLNGTAFQTSAYQITCRFTLGSAAHSVAATFVTSTSVKCITPAVGAGPYTLQVSNYNLFPSLGSSRFTFYDAVSPTSVNAAGGDVVTVTGYFPSSTGQYMVKFDTSVVSTTYVTSSKITCISPAHAAGAITVQVSRDIGVNFYDASPLFNYRTIGTPTTVFAPTFGTTVLTISGRSVATTTGITCDFGGVATSATVAANGDILCPVPAHAAGNVTFTLQNDGGYPQTWIYTFFDLPQITMELTGGRTTLENKDVAVSGIRIAISDWTRRVSLTLTMTNGALAVRSSSPLSDLSPSLVVYQAAHYIVIQGDATTVQAVLQLLWFTPQTNWYGIDYMSAEVSVSDLPSWVSYKPANSNVTVIYVNQAPSMTVTRSYIVSSQGSVMSLRGLVSTFVAGPTIENWQKTWLTVSTPNTTSFITQPSLRNVTGDFACVLQGAIAGNLTVYLTVHDDGGVANGGTDRTSYAFTIVVDGTTSNTVDDSPVTSEPVSAPVPVWTIPVFVILGLLCALATLFIIWRLRRRRVAKTAVEGDADSDSLSTDLPMKPVGLLAPEKFRLDSATAALDKPGGGLRLKDLKELRQQFMDKQVNQILQSEHTDTADDATSISDMSDADDDDSSDDFFKPTKLVFDKPSGSPRSESKLDSPRDIGFTLPGADLFTQTPTAVDGLLQPLRIPRLGVATPPSHVSFGLPSLKAPVLPSLSKPSVPAVDHDDDTLF